VQIISDLSQRYFREQGSVVTIGAFDGVHLGHRSVIDQVRARADELGCASVVVTFDRHPASIVRPESAPKLITDLDQKLELLDACGLDATVVVHFDEAMSLVDPAVWAHQVLVHCLAAQAVVVGEDFHFGKDRGGNVASLTKLGQNEGFEVEGVALMDRPDGFDESISSTAIRRALAGGQVSLAARLLGRPLEVRGKVVQGDQRGRLLGFPTANVEIPNQVCLPADGVYAGTYLRPDGSEHPCAINLGRRPTFYAHTDHSLLEAHLLDFTDDLYGEQARVRFVSFLRSERKFDGIDALRQQLAHDIDATRKALKDSHD
jgi:riboflavin kinase / FMN adenylyltransferase